MQIRVEGLDGVLDALRRKEKEIEQKIHKGLSKGGQIVKSEARARCPVDTGELRRSITKQTEGLTCVVGANKEYAGYVEFGTCKMAAKAFLIPALLSKKDEVIQAIADEVKS